MNIKKKIVGIIPARGGSKRLPRKNILPLNGKPLIAYAIESALHANIDRVIVSTDSEEIAAIARARGAEVPFLRPKELAADDTPDTPVFKHALEYMERNGEYFDYVLNLRPTTPLRSPADIKQIIETAIHGDFDLVRSVTAAEGTNHPYWMYASSSQNELKPLFEKENISIYLQSQQLPKGFYSLNGVVDLYSARHIKNDENVHVADRIGYIEIPRERSFDIDDAIDLEIIAIIMRNSVK